LKKKNLYANTDNIMPYIFSIVLGALVWVTITGIDARIIQKPMAFATRSWTKPSSGYCRRNQCSGLYFQPFRPTGQQQQQQQQRSYGSELDMISNKWVSSVTGTVTGIILIGCASAVAAVEIPLPKIPFVRGTGSLEY
jgi:hypothetical protein